LPAQSSSAIIFVRPIPKASAAAPQNNSAAKQSAQTETKTDTKSDAKSAGKSSPAQAPLASGSIEGWVLVVAALSPTRAQRASVNRTLSFSAQRPEPFASGNRVLTISVFRRNHQQDELSPGQQSSTRSRRMPLAGLGAFIVLQDERELTSARISRSHAGRVRRPHPHLNGSTA
jgi:hypothetical protein